MAWEGSDRRDGLPSWWPVTVRRILERDPVCMCPGCPKCWRGPMSPGTVCQRPSKECDHLGDRNDHRDEVLAGKCRPCHGRKSSQEGLAAREERKQPTGFLAEKDVHPSRLW